MMKELVVISGKGGTGKTSIVASFAALADQPVLADCDVDAADLHLVLEPVVRRKEPFSGGSRARVVPEQCVGCGTCASVCRFDAVTRDEDESNDGVKIHRIDPIGCEGCGVCAWFCPEGAIEFGPAVNGAWYVSDTRFGPMAHAELGPGEENSGKLVTVVRQAAKECAREQGRDLVIVDGSPGIGCPVIASITGADLVAIVTEPTLSGLHDLERVAGLARHFGIEAAVCINKSDLNAEVATEIEARSGRMGLRVLGKVRYDRAFTAAQVQRKSLVEHAQNGAAGDVRELWERITEALAKDEEP
jgi:MinD superfamily P-loop ATPase